MPLNFLSQHKDHLLLHLYVQPRASRNKICGLHESALKVRLKAPPGDSAANKMCLIFLAKSLNVSPNTMKMVSGQSSRTKTVKITPARAQDLATIVQKIRTLILETS